MCRMEIEWISKISKQSNQSKNSLKYFMRSGMLTLLEMISPTF